MTELEYREAKSRLGKLMQHANNFKREDKNSPEYRIYFR